MLFLFVIIITIIIIIIITINEKDVSCIIARVDYSEYISGSKHDSDVASEYSVEKHHQLLLVKYTGTSNCHNVLSTLYMQNYTNNLLHCGQQIFRIGTVRYAEGL